MCIRDRYLPSQRSFQPPHLGFAAFDHLLAPNQMVKANHTSAEENNSPSSLRRLPTKNSRFKPFWRWYKLCLRRHHHPIKSTAYISAQIAPGALCHLRATWTYSFCPGASACYREICCEVLPACHAIVDDAIISQSTCSPSASVERGQFNDETSSCEFSGACHVRGLFLPACSKDQEYRSGGWP